MHEGDADTELARRYFAQQGIVFLPVPRAHAEAGTVAPYARQLRRLLSQVGLARVIGKVFVTFSGYGDDPREVEEIPECITFWRKLNREVPELPILVGDIPGACEGPTMHMLMMAHDIRIEGRGRKRVTVSLRNGTQVLVEVIAQIRKVGAQHGLPPETTEAIAQMYGETVKYRYD